MSETSNGVEVLAATGGGQAMMAPGGGLSGGKLALATAEADDVLAGKTYYAGDKKLKTGTLALADATATASDVASGKTFYAGDKTLKTGVSQAKKLGYGNASKTFSATSISNYKSLTEGNFYVVVTGVTVGAASRYSNWGFHRGYSGSISISKSYSANNGTLTVTVTIKNPTVTWTDGANVHTNSQSVNISYDVYFAP